MAVIPVQNAGDGLANIAFMAAAAGGDTVEGGMTAGGWGLPRFLLVKNAHTAAQTVTVGGLPGVAVPPTNGQAVIPLRSGVYFGASIPITYSGVTALTVAAVDLRG